VKQRKSLFDPIGWGAIASGFGPNQEDSPVQPISPLRTVGPPHRINAQTDVDVSANCLGFLLASLPGAPNERDHELANVVERFVRDLPGYAHASEILAKLEIVLTAVLQATSWGLFVLDQGTGAFVLACGASKQGWPPPQSLPAECPLARFARHSPLCFLDLERGERQGEEDPSAEAARDQLRELRQEAALPLVSRATVIGFLTLGPGLSGGRYLLPTQICLTVLAQHLGPALDRLLLEEGLELIGRVSPGIAHDLQDLLTPISTFLQLQAGGRKSRQKAGDLVPLALRNLELLRIQLRRARAWTEDRRLRLARVRLDGVIRKTVRSARAALRERRLKVNCAALAALVAEVDEALVLRLLANLLSNAIHASPPGSEIRIGLAESGPPAAQEGRVEITIADNGSGIDPARLAHLLAPSFAQGKMETDGTPCGLGLAICKEIVRLHGGRLHLSSEVGRGTTATITLPVKRQKEKR
jgi:signal transduction histidine kinase